MRYEAQRDVKRPDTTTRDYAANMLGYTALSFAQLSRQCCIRRTTTMSLYVDGQNFVAGSKEVPRPPYIA